MADIGDIFSSLLVPEEGTFSPELAQYLLSLRFPAASVARYQELADRVSDGTLTDEEKSELDSYVQADAILSILKAKARLSMMQHAPSHAVP